MTTENTSNYHKKITNTYETKSDETKAWFKSWTPLRRPARKRIGSILQLPILHVAHGWETRLL